MIGFWYRVYRWVFSELKILQGNFLDWLAVNTFKRFIIALGMFLSVAQYDPLLYHVKCQCPLVRIAWSDFTWESAHAGAV